MQFLLDGHGERLKGYVHVGLCGVSAVAGAYNLAACLKKPRKRVVIGAIGYTLLALLEAAVARQHFDSDGQV